MALVRSIITDALTEIGVIQAGEAASAADAALALLRFQNQIDAWAADRLTLSFQTTQAISWPSSTSTQTVGPGGDINVQRPVWINTLTYTIPATSPAVEVVMGPMDKDSYAQQSIKGLQSGYPQQYFYQTNLDSVLGTLFIWPQPSQSLTLTLYAPKAVGVPVALTDDMLAPPGYQEAFMYQLAIRLCRPFGRPVPPDLQAMATAAWATAKRPNVDPGLQGVDPALTLATSAGYNILSDQQSAPSTR